jgi:hypothetical protein
MDASAGLVVAQECPPGVARLKLRDETRRGAEVEIELRLAAMALRLPYLRELAADEIRSPISFSALVDEVEAQAARYWTENDAREFFVRVVGKLRRLRDRRGPASEFGP